MTKTMRIGILSTVQNLDPIKAQDFVSALVLKQVFDAPFAGRQVSEKPRPVLFAGPLEKEPGGGEEGIYSALVRPDLTFSDGTPVEGEHIVTSLNRAAPFREKATAEAVGDRVVFRLLQPNARFDLFLSQLFCAVTLPKGDTFLGTGPFTVAPDATPQVMRLVKNPNYRSPVEIDELLFTYYEPGKDGSGDKLVEAFSRGEVEFCSVLHREAVSSLREVRKHFEPGISTAFLYFNTEHEGLQDRRLRQAMAMSINRLDLTQICYTNALAFSAKGLLPPFMSKRRDGLSQNLGRAKELIAEIGPAKPEKLKLLAIFGPRPYLPRPIPVAEYIAAQFRELGIEVEIHQAENSEVYYREIRAGNYDLALAGWIADTLDPIDFLDSVLSPKAIPIPEEAVSIHANLSRWSDAEIEGLLRRYRQDPSDENLTEILDRVASEVPFLPLMYGSIIYVHSWRVRNFQPTALGLTAFHRLSLAD